MKRFKLIFHICYIVITLVVLYFSIDVLLNPLSKTALLAYFKLKYVIITFMLLSILMLTEFILERLNNRRWKGEMATLEQQILELKAKLYDQSQEEVEEDPCDEDEEDDGEDSPTR